MTEIDVSGLSELLSKAQLADQTDEEIIDATTPDKHSAAQAEDKTPHIEQKYREPPKELNPYQEEVDKLRQQLETCRALNKTLDEDLGVMKERFNDAKAKCRELESNLAEKQIDVDADEEIIQKLVRRKTDKDIQFREMKLPGSSSEIRFDFVRTFYIKPKWVGATMAYMDGQGKAYFAKNGKDDDTAQGFISCVEYEEKANNLFNTFLDSGVDRTRLQHAEPKLMALYVGLFLSQNGLDLWDLQDQQEATSAEESHEPDTIRIFVSRPPCGTCGYLRGKVNGKTHKYGFKFTLENVSC